MKILITRLCGVLCITIFFVFFFVPYVLATNVQLSGTVTDNQNTPISGAPIIVKNFSNTIVANTVSDANGKYAVSVAGGIYEIDLYPPGGSEFAREYFTNITVDTNTTVPLLFNPTVLISGTIKDGKGNLLPKFFLHSDLVSIGSNVKTNIGTDPIGDGSYRVHVIPATYNFTVSGTIDNPGPLVNQDTLVNIVASMPSYQINTSKVQDLTIPTVTLTMTVTDQQNNPVVGAAVRVAPYNGGTLNLFPGGPASILLTSAIAVTDTSGVVHIPVVPYNAVSVTVYPVSSSGLSSKTVSGINVLSDTTLMVSYAKPGDANGDGSVNETDYNVWLAHYTQTTTGGARYGDFNDDGSVDGIDYIIWLQNSGV